MVKSYLDEAMSEFSQGKTLLLCLEALSAKDHDKLSNLILDLQPESDLAVLNELSLHLTSAYLDSELDRLKAWMANLPAPVPADAMSQNGKTPCPLGHHPCQICKPALSERSMCVGQKRAKLSLSP